VSAIIIDEEVIHYEVLGRGRPLIFVHGWLGSWRYWIPTMQALSSDFRTYALDLWGFGDSGKRADRYSLERQAELIHGFMDQLGIIKAAFIGHGLGGIVLIRFIRQYPDWADRLMAVNVPLLGISDGVRQQLMTTSPANLVETFLGRGPAMDPIRLEAAKTDTAALVSTIQAVTDSAVNLKAEVAQLPKACLLVYGEKDPLIPPPPTDWVSGFTGNVHLMGLEDSRHFPMLDDAARFNRLLADFLTLKAGEDLSNLGLKEEWKRRVR
jgi:pimeloyl-ACP methyl ester carboxylesterase